MSENSAEKKSQKLKLLEKRDLFLRVIRRFFHEKNFLEIDAPLLVPSAGMEPHLDPFFATGAESGREYYLPTSPEFYLKKVLAAGAENIFSLAPSFRDEEESKSHSPQFLMLEWYRAGSGPEKIVKDCEELFACLSQKFEYQGLKTSEGRIIKLDEGIKKVELSNIVKKLTGKELKELDSIRKWLELAKKYGAEVNEKWSENDCFSYLMIEKIEKELARYDKPTAVFGYPPFQSALAEVREDGLVDRFEIFIGGVEIANAYNELTGKQKNVDRYLHFQDERIRLGKKPHPADEPFFDAVEVMPKSAGIALGVDRLLSLLLECEIKECRNG